MFWKQKLVLWTATSTFLFSSQLACHPQKSERSSVGTRDSAESTDKNDLPSQSTSETGTSAATSNQIDPATKASQVSNMASEQAACLGENSKICQVEQNILLLVNQLRSSKNLQPFQNSPLMGIAARAYSAQMGVARRISHMGFPTERYQVLEHLDALVRTKISMRAENVAMSSEMPIEAIAERLFDMWLNSAGHRANMLGNFSAIGIGVSQATNGSWYGTQIFGVSQEK